jgi:hypothetical protein
MDNIQNAFNLASDLDKQIITLSTGILAISITFTKDVVKSAPKFGTQILLYCAWVCFLFAICAGLITMGKLTSASLVLDQSIGATEKLDTVMPFALLEEGIFLLGVLFTLGYGIGAGLDAAKQSRIFSGQSRKVVSADKQGDASTQRST